MTYGITCKTKLLHAEMVTVNQTAVAESTLNLAQRMGPGPMQAARARIVAWA